ncbi:hypothetical protein [Sediminibacillus terrae]|uniref:hypothetical protein n=1 Tax=Sediminibacillus terrae TaxID=1562106 RepID=UPI0012971BE2|nr:hypothetical protein [Sediminibacillus terrae]
MNGLGYSINVEDDGKNPGEIEGEGRCTYVQLLREMLLKSCAGKKGTKDFLIGYQT